MCVYTLLCVRESACVDVHAIVHASVSVRVPVPCGEEGDTKKLAAKQKIKSFPLSLAPQVFHVLSSMTKQKSRLQQKVSCSVFQNTLKFALSYLVS